MGLPLIPPRRKLSCTEGDTEDEAEIARYMRLLGGMAEEPGELQAGPWPA